MQKNDLNYRSKRKSAKKEKNVDIERKGDHFSVVQVHRMRQRKENIQMFVQKFR